MKLTGKCKEDFEKWYLKHIILNSEKLISNTDVNYFNLLTESMQYGVYVDFFDSCDIDLDEIYKGEESIILNKVHHPFLKPKDYRTEARISAIEKANEIYNNI